MIAPPCRQQRQARSSWSFDPPLRLLCGRRSTGLLQSVSHDTRGVHNKSAIDTERVLISACIKPSRWQEVRLKGVLSQVLPGWTKSSTLSYAVRGLEKTPLVFLIAELAHVRHVGAVWHAVQPRQPQAKFSMIHTSFNVTTLASQRGIGTLFLTYAPRISTSNGSKIWQVARQ